MKYNELLEQICETHEDQLHFRALVSARGKKMSDEIDSNFMDVLHEEGYF